MKGEVFIKAVYGLFGIAIGYFIAILYTLTRDKKKK